MITVAWRGMARSAIAAALLFLAASVTGAAAAEDRAWTNCSGDDPDLSIAGCTEVLSRGNRETASAQASAYYNRGLSYHQKGDADRALADYTKAIALNPKHANAYYARGNIYREKGDADRAIADYGQSIRLNPSNANVYFNRALAYRKKGDNDGAIADYTKSLELDATDAEAYYGRGNAYDDKGDYKSAIASFDKAIELKPDYTFAWFNRARTYGEAGDDDHAIADYSKAIELDPKDPEAYYGRGNAYKRKHDYDHAIADYDQALALKPDYADAGTNRDQALSERAQAVAAARPTPGPLAGDQPATPAAVTSETRVALVIGNSNYAAVGKLPNPPRDAAAVADALRADGFSDVQLVTDVTRQGLVHALNDFQDKAMHADWAVVYFAGHGLEMDGTNYVVPVDAALKSDRDVPDEAVSLDRIMTAVAGARKLRLVVLDACRNNPFAAAMRMTVASRSIHRGLARIEPSGGTLVAYAAKDGEEALDGDGSANSPFAAALVKYISTPGIEVGRLFRLVRDDVMNATENKQEPFVYGSLPGEELFFRPR